MHIAISSILLAAHTHTQLLLRFYDPTSGSLLLDGHDVKSLNVQYYRGKIGYVGQVSWAARLSSVCGSNAGLGYTI